jgi:hypothetical protein
MAAAFTFLCSEKDTLLDAAGNTIAVDRYNGVISKETIKEITNVIPVKISNGFLFCQTK